MEQVQEGEFGVLPGGLSKLISIIAIMLGRLEMDIDDCIDTYTSMFKKIFGKKVLPLNRWGKIKGRFDSKVLEECVLKIIKDAGMSETEPLNDGKERCKVYGFL